MSNVRRRSASVAVAMVGAAGLALTAASASAKTVTLHVFEKQIDMTVIAPDGTRVPTNGPQPSTPPPAGTRFIATSEFYTGNHKHHAKQFSATTHLACTVTGPAIATCDGQIAIGGSMLLANGVTLNFAQTGPTRVALNGGTGIYRHAHGTIVSTNIGTTNNSDDVLTFTY